MIRAIDGADSYLPWRITSSICGEGVVVTILAPRVAECEAPTLLVGEGLPSERNFSGRLWWLHCKSHTFRPHCIFLHCCRSPLHSKNRGGRSCECCDGGRGFPELSWKRLQTLQGRRRFWHRQLQKLLRRRQRGEGRFQRIRAGWQFTI